MAPRKMLLLVLLSSGMTSLLLFSFFQPPPLPLPEFMSMNASPWLEFGPDEQCLFVSPLSELTSAERQAAESLLPSIDSAFESPNGLLSFRPTAGNASVVGEPSADKTVHPVLGLLAQGERRWKNMIDKQSRTLGEAVEEYKKRMGRQPPKGFDHWWAFATANQVLFPDEYDPIMNSLLPFYALPPDEIAQRVTEAESIPETFTLIVKEGGKVVLQWNDQYSRDIWWNARTRADHQINLMEPFLDKLGEMRVTFSIHDQPFMVLPYERRQELEGLAKGRVGSYTSHLIDEDIHTADWINACPPDSPARTGTEALFIGEENGKEKDSVRFVVNHESAMNPCSNPSLLQSHIHFLTPQTESTKPKPHSRLLPILSLSRTEVNADIPVAPVGIVSGGLTRQDVGKEMDGGWPAQSPKLYWRGAPTANPKVPISPSIFANSHRTRLASLAQGNSSRSEEEHMLMVPSGARDGSVEVQSIKGDILAQKFLDVQLQGSWTCEDENDEQCNKLKDEFSGKPYDPYERSNEFKYVLDLDGNSWSKRFPKLMAARNLIIKAGVFPEWNMATLPPWFAYVPANVDFSDLYTILAFFRGSPSSTKGMHDRVAHRIASNGQCWVERTWRIQDMQAYAFRLLLEFERAVSPDRDTGKMDFHYTPRSSGKKVPVPEE